MPTSLRIASFNVENLFTRPKVLNLKDQSVGNTILEMINELQQLLKNAVYTCLLYTSDAADDLLCVDLGGRRIIKKKKQKKKKN